MSIRTFEDENGKIWIVTRVGSDLNVKGRRDARERLHKIAKSCAYRLGVWETRSGIPLEYINEHRRIWYAIWDEGRVT